MGEESERKLPESRFQKAMYTSEVARLLCERFRRTGSEEDIEEAVRLGRTAVELTHGSDQDRVGRWSRLAGILGERYKHAGENADTSIDEVMMADEFTGEAGEDRGPADDDEHLRRVLRWLWDTVASKVLEGLGITAQSDPSASLPRLWWCPTGSLSFLPIHAAGNYDQPKASSVLDCVVSSYTPTVRALVHAQERAPARVGDDDQKGRLLVVAMPHTPGTPGWADLPGAEFESRFLGNLFPNPSLSLEGSDANYNSVREALQQARWAHFACHAEVEGGDPSASRLVLSDHEERPLTVRDISRLNLDGTDLAFLSACETALGGGLAMADESIHLASAFQLAGFPRVIATMWPVLDSSAKKVVKNFYTALASSGDPSRAAQLLHTAVREYRADRRRHPSMWAFFIHAGAQRGGCRECVTVS